MTPDFTPGASPEDRFELEAELLRFARAAIAHRHAITLDELDEMLELEDGLAAELETFLEDLHLPSTRGNGIQFFEVAESPEGEMRRGGKTYAIVNSYRMRYVPNRHMPRWAISFGQFRSSQS